MSLRTRRIPTPVRPVPIEATRRGLRRRRILPALRGRMLQPMSAVLHARIRMQRIAFSSSARNALVFGSGAVSMGFAHVRQRTVLAPCRLTICLSASENSLPCRLQRRRPNEVRQAVETLSLGGCFQEDSLFGRQSHVHLLRPCVFPGRRRKSATSFQEKSHGPGQCVAGVLDATFHSRAVAEHAGQLQSPPVPVAVFQAENHLVRIGNQPLAPTCPYRTDGQLP